MCWQGSFCNKPETAGDCHNVPVCAVTKQGKTRKDLILRCQHQQGTKTSNNKKVIKYGLFLPDAGDTKMCKNFDQSKLASLALVMTQYVSNISAATFSIFQKVLMKKFKYLSLRWFKTYYLFGRLEYYRQLNCLAVIMYLKIIAVLHGMLTFMNHIHYQN